MLTASRRVSSLSGVQLTAVGSSRPRRACWIARAFGGPSRTCAPAAERHHRPRLPTPRSLSHTNEVGGHGHRDSSRVKYCPSHGPEGQHHHHRGGGPATVAFVLRAAWLEWPGAGGDSLLPGWRAGGRVVGS